MAGVSIDKLPQGQWAEVTDIAGDAGTVGRMAEIGLHIGSRFRMLRRGRPCLLEVHGSRLSLRMDRNMMIIARPVSPESQMMPLDKLPVGQRGCVTAIEGNAGLVQRLMEMGLFEGEEVEMLGAAPLGDPIEIGLRDYRLSLRRNEAACILIMARDEGRGTRGEKQS